MKNCRHKDSFTLVEILIVVGIIAILVSMVVGIASRMQVQDKERLVKNTFALLNAALEQFHDYGYDYKSSNYAGFGFPLDCNGFTQSELEETLEEALGAGDVSITGFDDDGVEQGADPNEEYSGCEVMWFFLNRVAESRRTLDKIDNSLVTSEGTSGNIKVNRTIIVDGKYYPLLRIIDPWGTTLRYDYYDEELFPNVDKVKESKRNFPLITSAGPDKEFGTSDDISSR